MPSLINFFRNTIDITPLQKIKDYLTTSPSLQSQTWQKIENYFPPEHHDEAGKLLEHIFNPPACELHQDTRNLFERLKELASPGYEGKIAYQRFGANAYTILDKNNKEIFTAELHSSYYCIIKGTENCFEYSYEKAHRDEKYLDRWLAWEREAPSKECADRSEAIRRLRKCVNEASPTVDLSNLNLTTLPMLPTHLTILDLSKNKLSELPTLPAGLKVLNLFNNKLLSLPTLPSALQELNAEMNRLVELPTLPVNLEVLNIQQNQVQELPVLHEKLQELKVSGNRLTALPALPPYLRELHANRNQLESVPNLSGLQYLVDVSLKNNALRSLPPLPVSLKSLDASWNQIAALPELSANANLLRLMLDNNQLTGLPASVALMSGMARLTLERNPLPQGVIEHIREMTSAQSYQGPQIFFSMEEQRAAPLVRQPAAEQTQEQAQQQAIGYWLLPEHSDLVAKWKTFSNEENLNEFTQFLQRLSQSKNARKQSGFKAQIARWLVQVTNDEALRQKTFAVALDSTSRCEDRVTLTLHHMLSAQLMHDVDSGKFTYSLAKLVTIGREMFRLQEIEQIAREKIPTLKYVDEVEVYLGFQHRLRKPLRLAAVTEEMGYFGVAGITEADVKKAETRVKNAENKDFSTWFAQWEPWHKAAAQIAPEEWEKTQSARNKAYDIAEYEKESEFTRRVRLEVASAKLSGDADAERIAGNSVMKKLDLEIYAPLTEKVLASKKLSHLLQPNW